MDLILNVLERTGRELATKFYIPLINSFCAMAVFLTCVATHPNCKYPHLHPVSLKFHLSRHSLEDIHEYRFLHYFRLKAGRELIREMMRDKVMSQEVISKERDVREVISQQIPKSCGPTQGCVCQLPHSSTFTNVQRKMPPNYSIFFSKNCLERKS